MAPFKVDMVSRAQIIFLVCCVLCGLTNSVFIYKREELLVLQSGSGEIDNDVRSCLDFIKNLIKTPCDVTTSSAIATCMVVVVSFAVGSGGVNMEEFWSD